MADGGLSRSWRDRGIPETFLTLRFCRECPKRRCGTGDGWGARLTNEGRIEICDSTQRNALDQSSFSDGSMTSGGEDTVDEMDQAFFLKF